jgi:hypothetical protein
MIAVPAKELLAERRVDGLGAAKLLLVSSRSSTASDNTIELKVKLQHNQIKQVPL